MKKKLYIFLCVFLFVGFIFVGAIVADTLATKSVVGFYRSDFTAGIGKDGPEQLAEEGYSYNIYSSSVAEIFLHALSFDKLVFIHSHGAPGLVTLSPSTSIT